MTVKRVIYRCYGGAHSSVVAAAIHLGQLSSDKIPDKNDLLKLNLFDRQTQDGHGQLHFFGFDEQGRQVYSVGCRNAGKTVERVLKNIAKKILGRENDLMIIDTLHCVNYLMRIGGYISRQLGFTRIGRPVVIMGTRQAYPNLVSLVEKTKKEADR